MFKEITLPKIRLYRLSALPLLQEITKFAGRD